ncbi:MAG TPA: hypothetical protein PK626_05470 [Bacteroidales bacterium]|nr:hypothetical protein [Bacteroidales bacterium]
MPNLKNKGYDRYNYMDKLKARRDVTNINNPELEKKVFAIKIMSDEYKANKQAYDLYLQQGYKNPMSF